MTDNVDFTPGELDRDATFYVAGHRGLVGSAIVRRLESAGFANIIGRASAELDLKERDAVFRYFAEAKPRYAVLAAAKVGGIMANSTYPVDFLSDNIRIQVNVLDAARETGVERLLFLGSSCIYPKFAAQPIREDSLLTGHLEPTNDAYAIAKIAGILHVQAVRRQYGLPWISAMPTNLYGPNDNFSPTGSHVLPALIRRYDEAAASGASAVTNWGTGTPRREFLHSDDMADACLHLLRQEIGAELTNRVARRMVVPPQRDGGQAQFIDRPISAVQSDSLAVVTEWAMENLREELTVDHLADRAHMSARTFARRFKAEHGATPAAWLARQRIIQAQRLLERTDLSLEAIAVECGFGSAAVLRQNFARVLGTTPTAYRATFSCATSEDAVPAA